MHISLRLKIAIVLFLEIGMLQVHKQQVKEIVRIMRLSIQVVQMWIVAQLLLLIVVVHMLQLSTIISRARMWIALLSDLVSKVRSERVSQWIRRIYMGIITRISPLNLRQLAAATIKIIEMLIILAIAITEGKVISAVRKSGDRLCWVNAMRQVLLQMKVDNCNRRKSRTRVVEVILGSMCRIRNCNKYLRILSNVIILRGITVWVPCGRLAVQRI